METMETVCRYNSNKEIVAPCSNQSYKGKSVALVEDNPISIPNQFTYDAIVTFGQNISETTLCSVSYVGDDIQYRGHPDHIEQYDTTLERRLKKMSNEPSDFMRALLHVATQRPKLIDLYVSDKQKDTIRFIRRVSNMGSGIKINTYFDAASYDYVSQDEGYQLQSDIEGKHFALATCTDDAFYTGTKTMIQSFLYNNPWFAGEIVLIHGNTKNSLSRSNKDDILSAYDKIVFREIQEDDYSSLIKKRCIERLRPAFYKIECFDLKGYDRVVMVDSDTIIIGDISYLFSLTDYFCAVEDTRSNNRHRTPIKKQPLNINTGMLSLSKEFVEGSHKKKILRFSNTQVTRLHLADQTLINNYMNHNKIDAHYISTDFNMSKRTLSDSSKDFNDRLSTARIIHYVGKKPWMQHDTGYGKIEGIWKNTQKKLAKWRWSENHSMKGSTNE